MTNSKLNALIGELQSMNKPFVDFYDKGNALKIGKLDEREEILKDKFKCECTHEGNIRTQLGFLCFHGLQTSDSIFVLPTYFIVQNEGKYSSMQDMHGEPAYKMANTPDKRKVVEKYLRKHFFLFI